MAGTASPEGLLAAGTTGTMGFFPKDLRRGLFGRLEPRFVGLFGGLLFVIGITIIILSNIRVNEEAYSKEAMQKIQERYAQLVLSQPEVKVAPKVVESIEKPLTKESKTAVDEKKEEVTIDRSKESFAQKQVRKESGVETRRQIREQNVRQIQSSGIFAALTASSGSGSTSGTSDLLGAAGIGVSNLGDLSLSKGTFATKNVDAADLVARKGDRPTTADISRETIGKTAVTTVASAAQVNVTTQPPAVSGESSSLQERSQSAIQNVVSRESMRLKRLYEEWLKRDPTLSGRLTVKFVILGSGAVSNVTIIKSSTNNSEFDDMVVRYIKRWQFSPVEGSGPVEVVYPFVFEGQS